MDMGDQFDQENRIRRLPTDILHIIFSILREMELASTIHGRRWMVVSHVCRKWRQDALASTNLWTIVNTSWGLIAMEFIRRSGTAPLKLWIILKASAPDSETEAINLAISHIFRACELHISVNSPADCLQDMWRKLQLAKFSQILTTISLSSAYKCPHLLFQNIPRGLRILETTMIGVLNQTVLLRQLTHLKTRTSNYSEIKASDMLVILGCCIELIDFEFHHEGPISAPLPGTASVTLPSLRRLTLSGCHFLIGFLSYLKFPPGISLSLNTTLYAPHLRLQVSPELYSQHDTCELNIFLDKIFVSSRSSTVKGQSTMDLMFSPCNGSDVTYGLDILKFSFPALLAQLRTFTIAPLPITSSTTGFRWEELLQNLHNLSSLVLSGQAPGRGGLVGPLANALSRPNEATQQPFCPNLRTLTVENFALYPIVQQSLVNCVASRNTMNARFRMLDISKCIGLEHTIFDELAPFVDEVVRPNPPTKSFD